MEVFWVLVSTFLHLKRICILFTFVYIVQNMEKRKPGKEADQEEDPARRFTLD